VRASNYREPMELKHKCFVSYLYQFQVSAKDMNDVSRDNDLKNFNGSNDQTEFSEDIVLMKINFYAIFFINIYIVAFVILIVYCTRCGENNGKQKGIFGRIESETDFESHLTEVDDPLIERTMYSNLVSKESSDDKWINHKKNYEKTL